jgi:hypothetical protein
VYRQAFEQVYKRVNPEIEKLLWLKMVKSSESMFEQGDWVIYFLQPVASLNIQKVMIKKN